LSSVLQYFRICFVVTEVAERLAAAKLKRAEPDPPDFARFWAAYKLTRNQPK